MRKQSFKASRRELGIHTIKAVKAGILATGFAAGASVRTTSQAGGVTVTQTTVQWPGKPPTNALDITLPNGHRLLWDTQNCRLYAWYDQRGVRLTNPLPGDSLWINREALLYSYYYAELRDREVTPFNDAWSSGGNPRPQFQGYTLTGDGEGIILTYTLPNWNYSGSSLYEVTYRAETRDCGVTYKGFSVQIRVKANDIIPDDINGVTYSPCVTLAPGGAAAGMIAWTFAISAGMRQTNIFPVRDMPVSAGAQPWVTLTHPQGTFVIYASNLSYTHQSMSIFARGSSDAEGVKISSGRNAPYDQLTDWTTDRIVFLFSHLDAFVPAPQRWINHRFCVCRELWNNLGIPDYVRYWYKPWVTNPGGFFSRFGADGFYTNIFQPLVYPNRHRRYRLFMHIEALESSVPGDPTTITGPASLQPELYLPNAVEILPPGDPYTGGTLAEWKDTLDAMRALGLQIDVWYRDYMIVPDRSQSRLWSRWDRTSSIGKFWQHHPDWHVERPDGTFILNDEPNRLNPSFQAYFKDWVLTWLIKYGIHGIFYDAGYDGTSAWYQRRRYFPSAAYDRPTTAWLHTNGVYEIGEIPMVFHLFGEIYTLPWAAKDKEWSYILCFGSGWPKGGDWSHPSNYVDATLCRRLYCMLTGFGAPATEPLPCRPSKEAVVQETDRYTQRLEQFGIPDRVELIAPVQVAPPVGILATAVSADPNDPATGNGGNIRVDGVWHFPHSGRVRIGNEVIWYRDIFNVHENDPNNLNGVIRGYDGTTPEAHNVGDPVIALDDQSHWVFDDAYWVYGQGNDEIWVRYSDGTIWRRPATYPNWRPADVTVSATAPTISNVRVTTSITSATITWTTDRPCIGWVEYDTFGNAEIYAGKRPAGWWPTYACRTAATALGTSHTVTLQDLQPGTIYHYRIVVRGPAQAVTPDATFTTPKQTAVTLQAPLVNK